MTLIAGFILGKMMVKLGQRPQRKSIQEGCRHIRCTSRRNIVYCLDCKATLGPVGRNYSRP